MVDVEKEFGNDSAFEDEIISESEIEEEKEEKVYITLTRFEGTSEYAVILNESYKTSLERKCWEKASWLGYEWLTRVHVEWLLN